MASVLISSLTTDRAARATVGRTLYGQFISFSVGGVDLIVPGNDDEAVEHATAWAAQLLNAAETIKDRKAAVDVVVPAGREA